MILRSLIILILSGATLLAAPSPAWADAASYIRTLFDATIAAPGAGADCRRFTSLAHFAAGQHWRRYDSRERQAFDAAFCDLVRDALARLKRKYPELTLRVIDARNGPNQMEWVRSEARAGGSDWPVDWLVGGPVDDRHLADLKVMGVSLAIMLRGMAANVPDSTPESVVRPWRRALDLALPE